MTTGRVLNGKNYNTPYLIASITKIMTCLLAIESDKLDETVVVDETIKELILNYFKNNQNYI